MVKTDYEFIRMELLSQTEKTQIYAVRNKKTEMILGRIGWYGAWRQYVFCPWKDTIFSKGCLKDIENFIEQLMNERKKCQ